MSKFKRALASVGAAAVLLTSVSVVSGATENLPPDRSGDLIVEPVARYGVTELSPDNDGSTILNCEEGDEPMDLTDIMSKENVVVRFMAEDLTEGSELVWGFITTNEDNSKVYEFSPGGWKTVDKLDGEVTVSFPVENVCIELPEEDYAEVTDYQAVLDDECTIVTNFWFVFQNENETIGGKIWSPDFEPIPETTGTETFKGEGGTYDPPTFKFGDGDYWEDEGLYWHYLDGTHLDDIKITADEFTSKYGYLSFSEVETTGTITKARAIMRLKNDSGEPIEMLFSPVPATVASDGSIKANINNIDSVYTFDPVKGEDVILKWSEVKNNEVESITLAVACSDPSATVCYHAPGLKRYTFDHSKKTADDYFDIVIPVVGMTASNLTWGFGSYDQNGLLYAGDGKTSFKDFITKYKGIRFTAIVSDVYTPTDGKDKFDLFSVLEGYFDTHETFPVSENSVKTPDGKTVEFIYDFNSTVMTSEERINSIARFTLSCNNSEEWLMKNIGEENFDNWYKDAPEGTMCKLSRVPQTAEETAKVAEISEGEAAGSKVSTEDGKAPELKDKNGNVLSEQQAANVELNVEAGLGGTSNLDILAGETVADPTLSELKNEIEESKELGLDSKAPVAVKQVLEINLSMFIGGANEKVQPVGTVTVTVPKKLLKISDFSKAEGFHFKDGKLVKLELVINEENVEFESDGFSYFVFAERTAAAEAPEDTKPEDTKPEDTKPEGTKPEDTKPAGDTVSSSDASTSTTATPGTAAEDDTAGAGKPAPATGVGGTAALAGMAALAGCAVMLTRKKK